MSTSDDPSPAGPAFAARADAFLTGLETAVDRVADDLDIDVLRSGNVVALTFDNDHKIIVNSQEAAEEIWVAARSGGFHYRWIAAEGVWRDTRSGETFVDAITRLIADEAGTRPVLHF